jgi:arylsulfatase A-like enzyme
LRQTVVWTVAQPHILILMTDQQRADCLRCAGHPQLRTPNIDRLAGEGMRFAQATTASPICMPARASFASGLYPHNHGIWGNKGEMPADDETFFQLLRGAGYFTVAIGKSHYYDPGRGGHMRDREGYMRARGFEFVHETTGPQATVRMDSYVTDEWKKNGLWKTIAADYRKRELPGELIVDPSPLAVEDYLDSYIGRQAEAFLGAYKHSRPLCLFVGFAGPHEPYDAPGPYAAMYRPEDAPRPIPVPEQYKTLPDRIRNKKAFEVLPQVTLDRIPQVRSSYYGKISLIDVWVGRILEAFRRRGWLDDALVVFLADHGEMLGDHGRLRKSTFHESNVRIPLILRWPGRFPANTVTDALAEIGDVFPTLLEAAGCDPSARCLGRSLWPVLRDPTSELRKYQLSEVRYGDRQIMIRSRQYKLAIDSQSQAYMLYDLALDPDEQHNLVVDESARSLKQQLRHDMHKRLEEARYGA